MTPRNFLYCWSIETADREQEDGDPINHIAGQQLKRVAVGDTIWIISYRQGEISLRGRIVVGEVTNFEGAAKHLGTHDLWESDYHLIAVPGTEEPLDDIALTDVVADLRFNSKVDRYTLNEDGSIDPHQIQTMRELTAGSAQILEKAWREGLFLCSQITNFGGRDGGRTPCARTPSIGARESVACCTPTHSFVKGLPTTSTL